MKLQIASFHGISFLSKVVKIWTRSEYSHVGYITKSGDLIETIQNKFWGLTHTFKYHSPNTPIEIWEKEIDEHQHHLIESFLFDLAERRVKYDWMGILGFVFKTKNENPKAYFCSEGICEAFIYSNLWPSLESYKIYPGYFVNLLKVSGFVLKTKIILTNPNIEVKEIINGLRN